uniref:Uncharacterized protein n=1 Tax=Glossina morsitans morsitans TaxID=37546 RepID=A0A1B0GGG5_GLOMM
MKILLFRSTVICVLLIIRAARATKAINANVVDFNGPVREENDEKESRSSDEEFLRPRRSFWWNLLKSPFDEKQCNSCCSNCVYKPPPAPFPLMQPWKPFHSFSCENNCKNHIQEYEQRPSLACNHKNDDDESKSSQLYENESVKNSSQKSSTEFSNIENTSMVPVIDASSKPARPQILYQPVIYVMPCVSREQDHSYMKTSMGNNQMQTNTYFMLQSPKCIVPKNSFLLNNRPPTLSVMYSVVKPVSNEATLLHGMPLKDFWPTAQVKNKELTKYTDLGKFPMYFPNQKPITITPTPMQYFPVQLSSNDQPYRACPELFREYKRETSKLFHV